MRPEHQRTRQRVCTEKARYDDRAAAFEAVRWIRRRQRRAGLGHDPTLHAYRCPFSGAEEHFHVGHPPSLESMKKIADAIRDLEPARPSSEYA